jgi:hypothetical protein
LAKKPDFKWNTSGILRDVLQTLKPYRSGRAPGHVAWHGVVRELVEREGPVFSEVWKRLRQYAKKITTSSSTS